MKKLLLCVAMATCLLANAQVRRIGVLGSSTANGQGVPFDSSWVQLLKTNYRSIGLIDTLQKIAASTFDCYSGMPTGYVPPAGRNSPNTSYNITRLMSRVPAPNTVIVNYPTTNFHIFSDQEILFCLDSIRKYANARGAKVFIATTQPRDNYDDAGRARLKYLNGVISSYFGDSTIDFFTPLNNPANNKLKPQYVLGDGVHPNSAGQRALYQQVLAKNVLNINMATIQRVLIDVGESAGTTSSPDAQNRRWNNMTDARKGVRVTNAMTTDGQPTTIKLEVVNPLASTATDNLNTGSSGSVGAVEEYGANATKDHALLSTGITNGTWRIYGLDPQKTYTIRFWGSFIGSGYRILQAKMAEETTWQEFNTANNRAYTTAVNFSFTGKTEQSFNLRVKANSVAAHINVVEIVATTSLADVPEEPNSVPVAYAGKDTTITLPADLQLNGTGTDTDGTVTYAWSQLSGPSASVITSPTTANPVISSLAAGTYTYQLLVTDNDGASDKDTVVVTVNAAPVIETSQRVLIDLGQASGPTATDQWGKRWNNVTDLRAGIRLSNAVTTTNEATTIRMQVIRPTGSVATNDLNVRTSNTVGVVGEYPASATNDNGLADKTITNGQWKFSGLTAASVYTIKFWGSINQSGPRIIQIKPSDQTTWMEFNTAQNFSYNQAASFTFSGKTEAAFDIRVKTGSSYGHINVIDLLVQVPAPTTPVADAGRDTTVTLPVDSLLLDGSASTIPDSVTGAWQWTKLSGPAVQILRANTAVATLKNLREGTYDFRLEITDSADNSSSDTVRVVVRTIPVVLNKLPLARAGADRIIRLPLDSLRLDGTASSDSDGVITSFSWQQVAGQPVLISDSSIATPMVKNLVAGNYVFALTVWDDSLATATDSVSITITAANRTPIVYAGPDDTIRLPVSTYNLSGFAADPDGNVTAYKWFKIAGPTSSALLDSLNAEVSARNLVEGDYQFALMVTDNDGATARDTIRLTVLPAFDTPPAANAGADLVVTLPAGAQLNGSGTDMEGTVAFAWLKLTGGNVTFSSTTVRNPVLGNLVAGVYTFELTVTDTGGLSDTDTVQLTVNPAVVQLAQRVLIDLGLSSGTTTTDAAGRRWNNITDLRAGLRLNNAVTTANQATTIRLEVIRTIGSVASNDLNVRTSNAVGAVGEYPASAANDNALADKTITNGQWKISGLQAGLTYNIKFWGSIVQTGARIIQIKRADQQTWQEYNATGNADFNVAANFTISGLTDIAFDIRVKTGSNYGHINVIDITTVTATSAAAKAEMPAVQSSAAVKPNESAPVNSGRTDRKATLILQEPATGTATLLHPNPTNGLATLRLISPVNAKGQVIVTNTSGQVVKRISFTKAPGSFVQGIDLTGQAAGLYFIRVVIDGESSEYRLLKY